jgi:arylsulfatase A-like enzyme
MALWEHCTRIPFLIRMPGQKTMQTVESCVGLQDLAPTLMDFAGVKSDYPMEGRSLRPLLENPATPWEYPVLTTMNQYDYAIRTSNWRYIRYSTGETELYDEAADPGEYHNLAGVASYAPVMGGLDKHMPPRPTGSMSQVASLSNSVDAD